LETVATNEVKASDIINDRWLSSGRAYSGSIACRYLYNGLRSIRGGQNGNP